MNLFTVMILAFAGGILVNGSCPSCDDIYCPKSEEECPLGMVSDPCGCCPTGRCGLASGESCYNQTVHNPEIRKLGFCGNNLNCVVSPSSEEKDELTLESTEGLCVCSETQIVCGSNNQTYENICALNEAAAAESGSSNSLVIQHWGPCSMVPEIVSGPQEVVSQIGQPVMLDCEVKGFPTPSVHWEFTGNKGSVKVLPSDDPQIAVQVRGGPESQMATSWVQLETLRPTDVGLYSCIATNEIGTARAMSRVEIITN